MRRTVFNLNGELVSVECVKCHRLLSPESFNKHQKEKTGLRGWCKECLRADRQRRWADPDIRKKMDAKNREYQVEHADEIKKKRKEKYHTDHEYREQFLLKCREDKRQKYADPVKRKQRNAREREKWHDPEIGARWKERLKKYHQTVDGQMMLYRRRQTRENRIRNTENTLTKEQWDKILKLQDNRCIHCKKRFSAKLKPTIDHIIPLSRGGGLTMENVQALCKRCNSRKNDKMPYDTLLPWMHQR